MSKRSNFEKVDKDFYPTTDKGVLVPQFTRRIQGKTYAEPCYGYGDLEQLLIPYAQLRHKSDIRPTALATKVMDGLEVTKEHLKDCDLIITNPPFTRKVLLPLIDHFIKLKPTWLLLPADYMHNIYFSNYMDKCSCVISIGRVCWFKKDGVDVKSTDNFAWYFWEKDSTGDCETIFIGRD